MGDLSPSGARVETDAPFAEGSEVELEIALPGGRAVTVGGVYQINAHVPWWLPAGMQQPLTIVQGGGATTLSVRVVD